MRGVILILLFVSTLVWPVSSWATYGSGKWKLTAYCSCPICTGNLRPAKTAGGVTPVPGFTVAADPAVLPVGTILVINGRTYMVQDTGGGVKGNHIDIYFDHHSDALRFGVQYADVTVVHAGSSTRR